MVVNGKMEDQNTFLANGKKKSKAGFFSCLYLYAKKEETLWAEFMRNHSVRGWFVLCVCAW